MSGDTELNPGPNKTNSSCKFYVFLLNLNNIAAHKLVRLDIIWHTFDIIGVSESYLDSIFSSYSKVLNIKVLSWLGPTISTIQTGSVFDRTLENL